MWFCTSVPSNFVCFLKSLPLCVGKLALLVPLFTGLAKVLTGESQ